MGGGQGERGGGGGGFGGVSKEMSVSLICRGVKEKMGWGGLNKRRGG